ncbi:hypothetical protein EGR_01653 [Echinococcus granulosus]|uniref:Uncharacterized protein n=1 Tax=Echinococcus granulosus TaxID=6210 RepID=W6USE9_ECHGR|nr:hypothetical protein EGR_01653 [Echinococcus granulosus]EUB63571.1 hypothetical protein EGR_01653 [Echinococcus granulosus]
MLTNLHNRNMKHAGSSSLRKSSLEYLLNTKSWRNPLELTTKQNANQVLYQFLPVHFVESINLKSKGKIFRTKFQFFYEYTFNKSYCLECFFLLMGKHSLPVMKKFSLFLILLLLVLIEWEGIMHKWSLKFLFFNYNLESKLLREICRLNLHRNNALKQSVLWSLSKAVVFTYRKIIKNVMRQIVIVSIISNPVTKQHQKINKCTQKTDKGIYEFRLRLAFLHIRQPENKLGNNLLLCLPPCFLLDVKQQMDMCQSRNWTSPPLLMDITARCVKISDIFDIYLNEFTYMGVVSPYKSGIQKFSFNQFCKHSRVAVDFMYFRNNEYIFSSAFIHNLCEKCLMYTYLSEKSD